MFRIGLKFPCNGLNRVKKNGSSRLYLTTRYYETRARIKYDQECRFSKDVKLISRIPVHKYSTDTPKREKSRGTTKTLLTLTAVAIGASGVLLYAKHDPKFRANLEGWIPGTDKTIQIIFQEESSYFEFIRTFFETLKQTIISSLFGGESKQAVAEKPTPPSKDVPEELMPANLVELETSCGEAASKAIAAYQKAVCVIQDYNKDVMRVVESLHATVGSAIWNRLKESTEKKKEAVKEAEDLANEAIESLNKIYNLIKDPKFDAPSHMKTAARRNIKKIMDDVDEAKKKYQTEIECGNMAERYWKQVKMARENLNEELQILFPNINIHEKKITLDENTFDLFVLHMYNKVSNLQRELEKTRTINESRIRAALKATGETMTEERLHTLVCLELDKEKQIYESEFSQKLLEEQKKFDDELRRQLKLQEQVHADHLQETITLKEEEAERNLQRALNEQSEQDSIKHKEQLAVVIGRLRGVEAAFKARMEEEKDATNAQILWSACTALARAIKSGPPGAPIEKIVRPLESEIKAVCKAAPKEDPLVMAAIKGIPVEAAKRGVFPEDILRERFLKVEQVARRLAMVPEEGAALPVYLLSYLQSYLMFKDVCPISRSELEDKPFDVEDLNTFDILNRARYWLDRGDFKMTLRYMNLLKGAPRSVAKDWMNETRILLETQQVVETLLAYAGAMGLMFLGAGDSKCSSKQRLQQTVDRRSWRRRRRKLVRKRRRIAERARRLRKRGARWTYKSIRSAVNRVLGWIMWKNGRGKDRNEEQVRFEVFLRSIMNSREDKGKMILLVQRDKS
ncbi:MICOS complex subunit Mic60 isoform X6 [Apis cerana]|uniref:MICOS complex subunit Mic60 isoform X6 n=2 Tax=Apis cerana TaxID=7461 RepID=UPI002B227555|nr:MICOS complex subunit Mic60 isoform X6 [Apis cerana]